MHTSKTGNNSLGGDLPSVFSYGSNELRTITIEDQPWFAGKDICIALGLKSYSDSLANLEDDERRVSEIPTPSGIQKMIIINESGVYHLIFRSNKPEAKAFRKWVTSEVLPQLRKTGSYQKPELETDPDLSDMIKRAIAMVGSQNKVAERLGINKAALSLINNGQSFKFDPRKLAQIKNSLKVLIDRKAQVDVENVELLIKVEDQAVRVKLFTKMKEGGLI